MVAGAGGLGSGASQLNRPGQLALDAKGNLFVADSGNNRVQEYAFNSASGTYVPAAITVAGVGGGVALDARGDLFVIDAAHFKILEYTYNPGTGSYSAGPTLDVSHQTGLQAGAAPFSVAFDANGNLFVSSSYLGYGGVSEFVYKPATATFAATSTLVSSGPLVGPTGIAFDSRGDLFVANTVQTVNPNQTVWNLVVELPYNPATGTVGPPPGSIMGQLGRTNNGVSAVALDGQANLFVADTVDNKVYEFAIDPASGVYSAAGSVVAGVGGQGTGANQLNGPRALALDSKGDLFISDRSRVVEYAKNPTTGAYPSGGTAVPGATQLSQIAPTALAVDKQNDLFAATGNQVLEFAYTAATATYPATGTAVVTEADSPGLSAVALDADGDLFVSDPTGIRLPTQGRVQELLLNPSTGAYAPTGIVVATQLSLPIGVAVDQSGNLFVYDGGTGQVDEYTGNPATGAYTATPAVVASPGRTNWPQQEGGVAVDARGDLLFSSNLNSGVVYELPASTTPPPPGPAVTAITPATGPAAGGTPVTVTGTNLTGGAVKFGTTPATNMTCTPASCNATSPAGTGTVHVTVTTTAGTSLTTTADQYAYQTPPPPPPPTNLIPNPGFENAGVPSDNWGSAVARSGSPVHGGSWALAQTTTSGSGGWDLDADPGWYATISSARTYTATVWVRATAAVNVNLNLDLLDAGGNYIDSADAPNVTLVPNMWTQLTITGIKPVSGEIFAGFEPNFSGATNGTVIYWDDMALTTP